MCAPHSGLFRDVHGVIQRREEGGMRQRCQADKGGIKRGENKLSSNHLPMCSPQSGPLRDVHGVTQRREEGGSRQRWPGE